MVVVPVAKLMSKDSFNFLRPGLLNQGVKYDNVFALPKSELEKR
jgi:hypothetical protein